MNFQPHSELNNPRERKRERALEESNRHGSFGRCASFVHHLPSAIQAPCTSHLSCKLRPLSLFSSSLILSLSLWPTKAESSTTCHRSTTHHPPSPSLLPLDRTTDLVAQSPKLDTISHYLATVVTHLFLSSHLSLTLSQLVFCLRKGANFFFFLVSTPTPNLSDLAVAVLHPLRSLSFPQSLTLSSSS